jgi:hypothetical protein
MLSDIAEVLTKLSVFDYQFLSLCCAAGDNLMAPRTNTVRLPAGAGKQIAGEQIHD